MLKGLNGLNHHNDCYIVNLVCTAVVVYLAPPVVGYTSFADCATQYCTNPHFQQLLLTTTHSQ
jgi:hypothetical protein